jgi:hypothetical protein
MRKKTKTKQKRTGLSAHSFLLHIDSVKRPFFLGGLHGHKN